MGVRRSVDTAPPLHVAVQLDRGHKSFLGRSIGLNHVLSHPGLTICPTISFLDHHYPPLSRRREI